MAEVGVVRVGRAGVAVGKEDGGFGFGGVGPGWVRLGRSEGKWRGLLEESEGEGAELVGEGRVRIFDGRGLGGGRC